MNGARWDTSGVKEDDLNVPLQLKRVLAAMRSTVPQPAPHHDFLHCLDRNCFRREGEINPLKKYVYPGTAMKLFFFPFTVNKQHDADELFLSILNLLPQQMDNKVLVGLPSKLVL